jgi:hypothetical protein
MEGHLTRLNDRTRKLEIWRGWLAGAIATMTIIGTIIGVI